MCLLREWLGIKLFGEEKKKNYMITDTAYATGGRWRFAQFDRVIESE